MAKLNQKQRTFAERYVELGNATEAYRQAGYSTKMNDASLRQAASKLLAKDQVAEYVEELQSAARKRHDVTIDKIVAEMAHIAFARFDAYHGVNPETGLPQLDLRRIESNPEAFAAIAGVKVKTFAERGTDGEFEEVKEVEIKFGDKLAALEKLGKHLGMFKETVVHEGEIALKNAAKNFDDQFTGFTMAVNDAAASALH